MNYTDFLEHSAKKFKSIVCFGMDPVIEKIPESGSIDRVIKTFYENILNRIVQKKIYPGAVKPNYAFYAQYGLEGLKALIDVIKLYQSEGLPVILDVKRGDIGPTALAYAKEAFEFFSADAVTLSPFLGYDSIAPFINTFPDKGYYILTKTSNNSSCEIQDIMYNGKPLYEYVSKKILDWFHPGIGSVVGATFPEQLSTIISIFNDSKKKIPLLIPGIGSQGGDLIDVVQRLHQSHSIMIHRINSSSGINYAYLNSPEAYYADAAVNAIAELNEQIRIF